MQLNSNAVKARHRAGPFTHSLLAVIRILRLEKLEKL